MPPVASPVGSEAEASGAQCATTAPSGKQQKFGARLVAWGLRAALILLFALYLRSVTFAPVYDDNFVGSGTSGRSPIVHFFTHDIFGSDAGAQSVYYRPVAQTWGYLVAAFTGGAPGWLHLDAILLHLAVVGLAFCFGRLLFDDDRMALLTAVLFGLHPSKVESVAWIGSSMVDGVGGVLFFATLTAFLQWRRSGSPRWRAGAIALFAAAMFTKETMVCIPVLMAAHLWLFPGEASASTQSSQSNVRWMMRILESLRALLPYAVVWGFYMAIRHQVIRPAPSSADYIHPTFSLANLWTAPYSIGWYLAHLLMPWELSVEYAPRVIKAPTLGGFVLPAAGIVFLLAAGVWLWWRQRSPVVAFLAVLFAVNLAPQVILAPMVSQHDRYLYLSAYSFCALVAWAILRLGPISGKSRLVAALCVIVLWSALSWHELGYWENDQKLWGRALEVSPSNLNAEVQMAGFTLQDGDPAGALAILSDGLRYHPDSPSLWQTRARVLAEMEREEEASAAYRNVLQVTEAPPGESVPAGPRAAIRADAAYRLGLMAMKARNFAEAGRYAQMALALDPDGTGYHALLGESLRGEGREEEGRREIATEIRLRLEQQRGSAAQSASSIEGNAHP